MYGLVVVIGTVTRSRETEDVVVVIVILVYAVVDVVWRMVETSSQLLFD